MNELLNTIARMNSTEINLIIAIAILFFVFFLMCALNPKKYIVGINEKKTNRPFTAEEEIRELYIYELNNRK